MLGKFKNDWILFTSKNTLFLLTNRGVWIFFMLVWYVFDKIGLLKVFFSLFRKYTILYSYNTIQKNITSRLRQKLGRLKITKYFFRRNLYIYLLFWDKTSLIAIIFIFYENNFSIKIKLQPKKIMFNSFSHLHIIAWPSSYLLVNIGCLQLSNAQMKNFALFLKIFVVVNNNECILFCFLSLLNLYLCNQSRLHTF